jgi:hypothetical protein
MNNNTVDFFMGLRQYIVQVNYTIITKQYIGMVPVHLLWFFVYNSYQISSHIQRTKPFYGSSFFVFEFCVFLSF